MAGLFDDKGFKVQPVMGKRARNKLNKHGFYRMPPNLKGLPAQSEGGLGGAISKGRKQRKFAEGGLAEMTPMDITGQMTQWEDVPEMASEDEFAGSEFATDDSGDIDGLAGGVSKNYSPDDLRERMALGRQKIANAYQNYMTQAQQTLQGMQAPKDTSWLAFAANMGKPKYGGGFAADLRNALGGFQGAQNDYQKQLQDFNATRARLGLDVAGIPLQQEYKLAEMEEKMFERDALRKEREAKQEELEAYHKESIEQRKEANDSELYWQKESMKQGAKAFKDDTDFGKKNREILEYLGKPGEEGSIEANIDIVGTGPLQKGFQAPAAKLADDKYTNAYGRLNQQIRGMRLAAAEMMKGSGAITEPERALLADFVGGGDINEQAFKEIISIFRRNRETLPKMLDAWNEARKEGQHDYLAFKNDYLSKAYMEQNENKQPPSPTKLTTPPKDWLIEEIGGE